MTDRADDTTLELFTRAALDLDDRWGYPDRVTFIDPKMSEAGNRAFAALREGRSVVMHRDGVELMIEPRRTWRTRLLRRNVDVTVYSRPLRLDDDAPVPVAAGYRSRVSRRSVFGQPLVHA